MEVFAHYLTLRDSSSMDAAVCNKSFRPRLLEVFSHPDCVLQDSHPYSKKKMQWILSRDASVDRLEFRKPMLSEEKDLLANVNSFKLFSRVKILIVDGKCGLLPQQIFLPGLLATQNSESDKEQNDETAAVRRDSNRLRSHAHTPRNIARKRHKMLKKASSVASVSSASIDTTSMALEDKLHITITATDSQDELLPMLKPQVEMSLGESSPASPQSITMIETWSSSPSPSNSLNTARLSSPHFRNGFSSLQEVHITGFKKLCSSPTVEALGSSKSVLQAKASVDFSSSEALLLLFGNFVCCDQSSLLALDFSGCWDLSDRLLCGLLQKHSPSIRSLNLTACFQLSDEGLKSLFWLEFPNLTSLNLTSCGTLTTATLKHILARVGHSLVELVLTDCIQLTEEITFFIRMEAPRLRKLELSGIKAINDLSMAYLSGVFQSVILEEDEPVSEDDLRSQQVHDAMHFHPPRRYYVDDDYGDGGTRSSSQISQVAVPTIAQPLPLECLGLEGCVNISLVGLQQVVDAHRMTLKRLDLRYCGHTTAAATLSDPFCRFLLEAKALLPDLSIVFSKA